MFEGFIRNTRTGRYNFMCSIDSHGKYNQSSCDDVSSGGGCSLPSNSTTEELVLLGATMDFIGCWIKSLKQNMLELCNMYDFNMNKLFQKTPVEIPKQPSPKEKKQIIIT